MKTFDALLYDAAGLNFFRPESIFRVQTSIVLLLFILLIAVLSLQTLGALMHWYGPYLIALGAIILAALIQHTSRVDDV